MTDMYANRPLVSVIVATHDSEATIRRAVESIQNQTHRSYELIAVDDASTDSTPRLLDAMADRDVRMQVLSTDGCGRQGALDLALQHATGEWLLVLDDDGWAEPGLLASLVGLGEKNTLDLAIAGFTLSLALRGRSRARETQANAPAAVFPTQHEFRTAAWRLMDAELIPTTAAKLFRLDRVRALGCRFSGSGRLGHGFVVSYLSDVERVGVSGTIAYHVSRVAGKPDADDIAQMDVEHEALVDLYRHWGMDGDAASMEVLQSRYLHHLCDCIQYVCGSAGGFKPEDRRRIVGSLICTDRAKLAASVATPRTPAVRVLAGPIRTGNVSLAVTEAGLAALLGGRGIPSNLRPATYL